MLKYMLQAHVQALIYTEFFSLNEGKQRVGKCVFYVNYIKRNQLRYLIKQPFNIKDIKILALFYFTGGYKTKY